MGSPGSKPEQAPPPFGREGHFEKFRQRHPPPLERPLREWVHQVAGLVHERLGPLEHDLELVAVRARGDPERFLAGAPLGLTARHDPTPVPITPDTPRQVASATRSAPFI